MRKPYQVCLLMLLISLAAGVASAQSFRVQCPPSTLTHPDPTMNNSETAYTGPTQFTTPSTAPAGTDGGFVTPVAGTVNGAIKCQQISGGDGLSTMADGTQIFMFAFGPLSGLTDVAAGLPSTQFPGVFNTPYPGCTSLGNCATPLVRGDPATTDGASSGASPGTALPKAAANFQWNGAVGLAPDVAVDVTVSNLVEGPLPLATSLPPAPPPLSRAARAALALAP